MFKHYMQDLPASGLHKRGFSDDIRGCGLFSVKFSRQHRISTGVQKFNPLTPTVTIWVQLV